MPNILYTYERQAAHIEKKYTFSIFNVGRTFSLDKFKSARQLKKRGHPCLIACSALSQNNRLHSSVLDNAHELP